MASLLTAYAVMGEPQADSLSNTQKAYTNETFEWKQLIAPTALLTIGSLGVNNGWLKGIKNDIRDNMSHLRGQCYFHADDYLQYLPAVSYLGVGFIPGNKGKHSFTERICAGVTAYSVMAILTNVTKVLVKEPRPDTGARNSFPSGHTATAFTGAELLRMEYGTWVGLGGYLAASSVGFLRLYNNRHWINDILAGAGIGILSAHVGYWLLPWERKIFKIKPRESLLISPMAGYKTYGITVVATL